jgi:hypothetical protein
MNVTLRALGLALLVYSYTSMLLTKPLYAASVLLALC